MEIRSHTISVFLLCVTCPSSTIKILDVHTSGVVRNGTEINGINNIIDCDYEYDKRDEETFELKWYFRHDPTPIYTWVPPNRPQVSSLFISFRYCIFSNMFDLILI